MKSIFYKSTILKKSMLALVAAGTLASCSDDFLKPDPLSFYEPTTTFSTESGLKAALAVADRHLRIQLFDGNNNNIPFSTELMFSDMGLWGKTDAGGGMQDNFAFKITPTSNLGSGGDTNAIKRFWDEEWNGVKYANTIIHYAPMVKGLSEQKLNQALGRAYFHRAFRYYNLVFQFGDIPLVTKLLETPKQNYTTCPKTEILKKMAEDLEFSVEWVPTVAETNEVGMVTKEACRMLLAKIYLAIGRYKDAETQCNLIISSPGLDLMKNPFGTFEVGEAKTWPVTRNVIWDLHRSVNVVNASNTEMIMPIINVSTLAKSMTAVPWMRVYGPFWASNFTAPDGKNGMDRYARNNKNYDVELDWNRALGRGIATVRSTYYAQHSMWVVNGVEDKDDLRHNSKVGNWVNMEDIRYNRPGTEYYGKNLQLFAEEDYIDDKGNVVVPKGKLLCSDTIRSWHDCPLYKIWHLDHTKEAQQGSNDHQGITQNVDDNGNQYLYRLAEAYLVRAEAKFYQKDAKGAGEDLNVLRRRAQCSQFYNGPVTIGDIMDERGRELWFEEWRNVELTRVSLCLANTGIADEWGYTYGDNWDKQSGTDKNGGSYWYQRLMHHSLYNCGYTMRSGNGTLNYTMDKRNVYWPIPHDAIEANSRGQLRQNYGYDGYSDEIPMWKTWQEAVADEDKN